MNRRNFITTCATCASLCAFQCYKKFAFNEFSKPDINSQENLNNTKENGNEPIKLIHIGVLVTQHCNLGCKYCNHFSNIAEEEYYDVKQYEEDMKHLSEVVDMQPWHINLLGGEPLLHPEIIDFFYITRKYFRNTEINLITNGILLDSKEDDFWRVMSHTHINLEPTIYPIKINWESIAKKAEKFNVNIHKMDPIKYFERLKLDLSGKQPIVYCPIKGIRTRLVNGKLYPCFIIANIRHFNKKFNKNLRVTRNDYLDIRKVKKPDEITKFLNQNTPFCKYCRHYDRAFPWENSNTHGIEEWT